MAKRRKKEEQEVADIPIASMIDIVFLLIIFFVVTAAMEKEVEDEHVKLSDAPHGRPLESKNPRSVTINIRENGKFLINGIPLTETQISNVIKDRASEWYPSDATKMPIIIRADKKAKHGYVKKIMKAVTDTKLYKIKFMAVVN